MKMIKSFISGTGDENGFLDPFVLGVIAVIAILVVAFLFGGIFAFVGALLIIIGVILLFYLYPLSGIIIAGIGLVLLIAATQLHMGIITLQAMGWL